MTDDTNFARTWRDIATEASRETDPRKLQDLAEELNRALTQQSEKGHAAQTQEVPHRRRA